MPAPLKPGDTVAFRDPCLHVRAFKRGMRHIHHSAKIVSISAGRSVYLDRPLFGEPGAATSAHVELARNLVVVERGFSHPPEVIAAVARVRLGLDGEQGPRDWAE